MFAAVLAATLLTGLTCGRSGGAPERPSGAVKLRALTGEAIPLAASPVVYSVLSPTASGTKVERNGSATIDYSNAQDGYIMIKWSGGGSNPKIKVRITGPKCPDVYQYTLRTDGNYDVFPLSDGDGTYKVEVWQNVYDNKYSQVLTAKVSAQLTDQFAPFIRPNQYVNYSDNSAAVSKAADLIAEAGAGDNLSKVRVIYEWVVSSLTYDKQKAANPPKNYVPNVDTVLSERKGICFDYAALMSAMLRSQGVPIKLVVGYTSSGQYHAWINVWSEDGGWVDSMIYFDGQVWSLMDPTFASSSNKNQSVMEFIGDGTNYKEKFVY